MENVSDRTLWGNEAADDEVPEILNTYFFTPNNSDDFFSNKISLSIARARKGYGKSAMINELAFRVSSDENIKKLMAIGWTVHDSKMTC